MPQTPNSSLTNYVSNQEFLLRFDANLVGQLVSDANQQADTDALNSDPVLSQILADASGQLESAALLGGRYTSADLQALNGVSLSYLKRIVSNLAMGMLRQRRGMIEEGNAGFYQQALNALTQLAEGTAIFAFVETEAAGSVVNRFLTDADFAALRLLSNNTRSFGILADRGRTVP